MTREEIFQIQGELVVLERELEELEIAGNNSLIILYNLINPDRINSSILDIELKRARVEFKDLSSTWEKAKEIKTKADKLKFRINQLKSALI